MRVSLFCALFILFTPLSWGSFTELKNNYLSLGGSPKAFDHLECIAKTLESTQFQVKEAFGGGVYRCNELENGTRLLNLRKREIAVIVDYTLGSSQKRFFVLDLRAGTVTSHYVSHGRYKAGRRNKRLRKKRNTVETIQYYSNKNRSRASSSGLFLTGEAYQGRWKGPEKDKYSLILHGLEKEVNDNACTRAIVMHGHQEVKETGPKEGISRMSSGCFMLDYELVNEMVRRLKGHEKDGGAFFFVHSEREEAMASDQYCRRSFLEKSLHLEE